VRRYEVESVEYFGQTAYHAFSNVHTRLYFADGSSLLVSFRFEAGHNEGDWRSLYEVSTIRAGAWMALGRLLRDPAAPPPGWIRYLEHARPYTCQTLGPPYAIGD
jgi:hypothetical protein